ncbi:MAG: hypothetical protein MUE77_13025 [Sandarakinorhabdus sp.]|nr:hypothetical protein [Sandarakinorhabdus sp.]
MNTETQLCGRCDTVLHE